MQDYHNRGLFNKALLIFYFIFLAHQGANMKGSFVLLWLKSPVLVFQPVGFNVEMRAKSTATHCMIAHLAFFFFPRLYVHLELAHLIGLERLFMGHLSWLQNNPGCQCVSLGERWK